MRRASHDIEQKLEVTMDKVSDNINDEMEKLRSLAPMFSRITTIFKRHDYMFAHFTEPFTLSFYRVPMLEISYQSNIIRREFAEPAGVTITTLPIVNLTTTSNFSKYMWEYLTSPHFHRRFSMSFAELVSNTVMIRNASLIYDEDSDEKIGMAIASFALDREFLHSLTGDNPDLVVFAEVDGHYAFSNKEIAGYSDINKLYKTISDTPDLSSSIIRIKGLGQFYLYKIPFFSLLDEKVVTLGILYGFKSVNRFMEIFQGVAISIFLASLIAAIIVALYLGNRISVPIMNLSQMANEFEKNFVPVPRPPKVIDEITHLQNSLGFMSENILLYKEGADTFNTKLSGKVEEQTRDLMNKIRSLTLINDFSSFIMNIDYLNEIKFIKKSLISLKDLLNLGYISIFWFKKQTPKKLDYFYSETGVTKKAVRKKIEKLEKNVVNRVFHTGDTIIKSGGNISVFTSPIYFIDQIEYCLFYIGERRKLNFIRDSMTTINNLLSMKIYSIRINKSKLESDKLASLGQFASTIIHDIKNPLTTIKSSIEIFTDDDYTTEEKEAYKQILYKEINLLTNMLNDILDFSKGQMSLHRTEINIDEFLNELVMFYKGAVNDSGIKIHSDLKSGVTLLIDRDRIWRSIGNIVGNAIDALTFGGNITITSEKKIYDLVIKVQDNGPGIPEDIRDKIFEPFFTSGKSNGTGLGLAIVKKVIEAHGGNVNFKTEAGKGTTFYIYIPL
jgi:signal transduction histidine kinase